jgi:hypothetical protein
MVYAFAATGFDGTLDSARFTKDCKSVSRNEKKTSTENPIKNAIAGGDSRLSQCEVVKQSHHSSSYCSNHEVRRICFGLYVSSSSNLLLKLPQKLCADSGSSRCPRLVNM